MIIRLIEGDITKRAVDAIVNAANMLTCFPLDRATAIARQETERVMTQPGSLSDVEFVCYNNQTYQVYERMFADLL